MTNVIDKYPTRLFSESKFIKRDCRVAYFKSNFISRKDFDFYEENGFLIKNNFFTQNEINDIYKVSDKLDSFKTLEPNNKSEKRAVSNIHENLFIQKVAENEKLIDIVKKFLGSDIYIHQSRINYKKSLSGSGWHWHSDFETWHAQDGMPYMRCLSAMIPLTDNNECNGSLMVIPKSHKYFWSSKKSDYVFSPEENYADQKEGVPDNYSIKELFNITGQNVKMIKCKPTDLILFDCNLMHVSTQNLSNNDRTNLFIVYNSIENKLLDSFSYDFNRPNELGNRNISKIY